jgi:hypothetical protein
MRHRIRALAGHDRHRARAARTRRSGVTRGSVDGSGRPCSEGLRFAPMLRSIVRLIILGLLMLGTACGARVSPSAMSGAPTVDSGSGDASSAIEGGAGGGGSSSSSSGGGTTGSGTSCEAAGGQCLIGDEICATPGSQTCAGADGPAGVFCCLSQAEDCGQPATTSLSSSCDPGSVAAPSCAGMPPTPPPFGTGVEEDPDASFPSGCTVTFPYCNSGSVIQCTCKGDTWNCYY